MGTEENLKISFQKLLKKISNRKIKDFTGLGLILYKSKFLSNIPSFDLRPSFKCPKGVFIKRKRAVEFLSMTSRNSHPCHDGYSFFNEKGKLTHISQYLAVPLISKIIPNELYGARHLSAQLASHIKGVIAVGTIDRDYSSSYFEKGKYHTLDSWNLIYKKGEKNYQYYDFTQSHRDIHRIVKIFNKKKIRRILDLGCGAGRNLLYLAKKGFEMYGIDIAGEGIKITKEGLRERKLKAILKVGNIFKSLPYRNNFFDAIISVQVLQHGKFSQINKAIKEIERILKPGGFVFITLCGRYSKGKVRYCVVKTAKKIAPRTYLPTIGNEAGIPHYVYDKATIKKHYKNFKIIDLWRDDKDYYCFLGRINKN